MKTTNKYQMQQVGKRNEYHIVENGIIIDVYYNWYEAVLELNLNPPKFVLHHSYGSGACRQLQ
jgi:hypothetical protein